MKPKRILIGATVCALCVQFLTGCMAVRYVGSIGERSEHLSAPGNVRLAADGSVALEVKAHYYGGSVPYSVPKYLVGSTQAMAALFQLHSGEKVNSSTGKQRLSVTSYPHSYSFTNSWDWRLIPPRFGSDPAIQYDLPEEFRNSARFSPTNCVDYEFQGRVYEIEFREEDRRFRTSHVWWSFPVQLLVVPAAAIDVATGPFQLIYLLGRH